MKESICLSKSALKKYQPPAYQKFAKGGSFYSVRGKKGKLPKTRALPKTDAKTGQCFILENIPIQIYQKQTERKCKPLITGETY